MGGGVPGIETILRECLRTRKSKRAHWHTRRYLEVKAFSSPTRLDGPTTNRVLIPGGATMRLVKMCWIPYLQLDLTSIDVDKRGTRGCRACKGIQANSILCAWVIFGK